MFCGTGMVIQLNQIDPGFWLVKNKEINLYVYRKFGFIVIDIGQVKDSQNTTPCIILYIRT